MPSPLRMLFHCSGVTQRFSEKMGAECGAQHLASGNRVVHHFTYPSQQPPQQGLAPHILQSSKQAQKAVRPLTTACARFQSLVDMFPGDGLGRATTVRNDHNRNGNSNASYKHHYGEALCVPVSVTDAADHLIFPTTL